MARLMSVALTEQAVVERRKTVTRRAGWWVDKRGRRLLVPGDRVTLCRKVMGRKADEPLVRLVDVEVVDVRRELLQDITADDVAREGFPGWSRERFLDFFCDHMGGTGLQPVTRIEWRYLDTPVGGQDAVLDLDTQENR